MKIFAVFFDICNGVVVVYGSVGEAAAEIFLLILFAETVNKHR